MFWEGSETAYSWAPLEKRRSFLSWRVCLLIDTETEATAKSYWISTDTTSLWGEREKRERENRKKEKKEEKERLQKRKKRSMTPYFGQNLKTHLVTLTLATTFLTILLTLEQNKRWSHISDHYVVLVVASCPPPSFSVAFGCLLIFFFGFLVFWFFFLVFFWLDTVQCSMRVHFSPLLTAGVCSFDCLFWTLHLVPLWVGSVTMSIPAEHVDAWNTLAQKPHQEQAIWFLNA